MANIKQKMDMESPLKQVFLLLPYQLEKGHFGAKKN